LKVFIFHPVNIYFLSNQPIISHHYLYSVCWLEIPYLLVLYTTSILAIALWGKTFWFTVYGIPVQEFQRDIKYKPQVKLYFKEKFDSAGNDNRTSLSRAEITFRLMNETSETITRTKAEQLAKNIKREFGTPIFVWEKGWYKATYLDAVHGYDLRLLVKSKLEAIRIIKQVLQIQSHTYNNDYLQYVEHDRTYSLNPGTHRVYGNTVKKIVQRPRVDVRFKYAQLLIWGRVNPINLVATGDNKLCSVIERI
jgi:hypothetical protein